MGKQLLRHLDYLVEENVLAGELKIYMQESDSNNP
jgi:hypothetical protein